MHLLKRDPLRGIGRFFGVPQVEFLPGGAQVRMLADFIYEGPDGKKWIVPKGLVSDGASIPRGLWNVIGPPIGGPYFFAGLVHDARYRLGDCTKDEADMILWDACEAGGTSEELARTIVEGVALGGDAAWHENAIKRLRAKSHEALLEWV